MVCNPPLLSAHLSHRRLVSVARSRTFREHQGKVLLEGRRLICDALDAGANPQLVFFSTVDRLRELPLEKLKRATLVKVKFEDIKIWSDLVAPQGVIGKGHICCLCCMMKHRFCVVDFNHCFCSHIFPPRPITAELHRHRTFSAVVPDMWQHPGPWEPWDYSAFCCCCRVPQCAAHQRFAHVITQTPLLENVSAPLQLVF